MFRWDSQTTARAAGGLAAEAESVSAASGKIRGVGSAGPAAAGHREVAAGIAEFAAFWTWYLDEAAPKLARLADTIHLAGRAYDGVERALATGFRGDGAASTRTTGGPR